MAAVNGHNPSSLRVNNRQTVLTILRGSESITVSQIARSIELSKTTLWKIMDHLITNNLAVKVGKAESSDDGGKKPELYSFNGHYGYVISIAVYGSFLLLALADARANLFYKEKIFIHPNESLDTIVGLIAEFIRKWQKPGAPGIKKGARLLGIAIALSGVVDSARGLCLTASRFSSWPAEAPIRDLIEAKVQFDAPFYIDNYNRFFAFAEKTLGCAQQNANIIDVVAGFDGLGAGVITENKIKRGPRYLTGEIGHMRLDPHEESLCHCGGKGCFEQLVSGDRLVLKAREGKAAHPESGIYAGGDEISLQTILDAANADDAWARALVDEVIKWFAIGLQNTCLVFNPEVIVITGNYRNAGRYFFENLSREMEGMSLVRMNKNIEIRFSDFDEEGAVLGAASYVLHDYFTNRQQY